MAAALGSGGATAVAPGSAAAAPGPGPGSPLNAPLGLLMTLLSSLAFSAMALLVSLLHRFASFEMTSVRFWVQGLLTVLVICVARRSRLWQRDTWLGKRENLRLLLSRGLIGGVAFSCYFYSLAAAPHHLAEVSLLVFLNVPLTAVFAALSTKLKERFTVVDGVVTVVCLAGVVLVAQPASIFGGGAADDEPLSLVVVLVSLFGAVCSALAYVAIRMIGPNEDALVITLVYSTMGAVLAPVSSLVFQQTWSAPEGASEWVMMVAIGATAFVGQVLLNRGIQIAPAGPAAVMRYGDVIFGIIFQATIHGRPLTPLKWVGAVMVLSGVVSVLYKQRRKAQESARAAAAAAATTAAAEAVPATAISVPAEVAAAAATGVGAVPVDGDADTTSMLDVKRPAARGGTAASRPSDAAGDAAAPATDFAVELAQLQGGGR